MLHRNIMGTNSIILIRERNVKENNSTTSVIGGPIESKYSYEYYVCIYQHFDGYVEDGVGEWMANFISEVTRDLGKQIIHVNIDAGLLGAKLIQGCFFMNGYQRPRLIPIAPLEE